jgi:hypothetical protein
MAAALPQSSVPPSVELSSVDSGTSTRGHTHTHTLGSANHTLQRPAAQSNSSQMWAEWESAMLSQIKKRNPAASMSVGSSLHFKIVGMLSAHRPRIFPD